MKQVKNKKTLVHHIVEIYFQNPHVGGPQKLIALWIQEKLRFLF